MEYSVIINSYDQYYFDTMTLFVIDNAVSEQGHDYAILIAGFSEKTNIGPIWQCIHYIIVLQIIFVSSIQFQYPLFSKLLYVCLLLT